MPAPVSRTDIHSMPSAVRVRSVTEPPAGVNLSALSMRIMSTCIMRSSLPSITGSSPGSTARRTPSSAARFSSRRAAASSMPCTCISSRSMCMRPSCRRLMSSMSVIRRSRRRVSW